MVTIAAPPDSLPPGLRTASVLLAVMAVMTGLVGVATTAVVVSLTWLDPTLGGDPVPVVLVGLLTAALWLGGAGVCALLAVLVPQGQPGPRMLATLLGVAWLLTPAFPLALWLLISLWRSE